MDTESSFIMRGLVHMVLRGVALETTLARDTCLRFNLIVKQEISQITRMSKHCGVYCRACTAKLIE